MNWWDKFAGFQWKLGYTFLWLSVSWTEIIFISVGQTLPSNKQLTKSGTFNQKQMVREIKYIPLGNIWVVFVLYNIEIMWDLLFCLISSFGNFPGKSYVL